MYVFIVCVFVSNGHLYMIFHIFCEGKGNGEGGVELWTKSCTVSILLSEDRLHVTTKGKGLVDLRTLYCHQLCILLQIQTYDQQTTFIDQVSIIWDVSVITVQMEYGTA